MQATVADFIRIMNQLAPFCLAEDWDNIGLQAGCRDWPVKRVWVALDPLPQVVDAACKNRIDLLVTHHPLLLNPLKKVDFSRNPGSILYRCSRHHLAVISAHTNYDSASGGLNDALAQKLELVDVVPLSPAISSRMSKLVVFVPATHERELLDILLRSTAGRIDGYSSCSFRVSGLGTFRADLDRKPFQGKPGELTEVDETRIEMRAPYRQAVECVELLRQHHPYEMMSFDIYPLAEETDTQGQGLGRIGRLTKPVTLDALAKKVKDRLSLEHIRCVGRLGLEAHKVAVCTGSGSGLLKTFLASDAQVYISGDIRYHDARQIEIAGRGCIDAGHFPSEQIMVKTLTKQLQAAMDREGLDAAVEACELEEDPFKTL